MIIIPPIITENRIALPVFDCCFRGYTLPSQLRDLLDRSSEPHDDLNANFTAQGVPTGGNREPQITGDDQRARNSFRVEVSLQTSHEALSAFRRNLLLKSPVTSSRSSKCSRRHSTMLQAVNTGNDEVLSFERTMVFSTKQSGETISRREECRYVSTEGTRVLTGKASKLNLW